MSEINDNENIEKIEFLLRRVCFDIRNKGREILQYFDITPPQFDALQWIVCEKEITIGELSDVLYLAPSTISDLIQRMEKNLLVQRVKDEVDRRVVKVIPLPKGHEVIEKVIDKRQEYIRDSVKNMDIYESEDFIKYLEIIYSSCDCCKKHKN